MYIHVIRNRKGVPLESQKGPDSKDRFLHVGSGLVWKWVMNQTYQVLVLDTQSQHCQMFFDQTFLDFGPLNKFLVRNYIACLSPQICPLGKILLVLLQENSEMTQTRSCTRLVQRTTPTGGSRLMRTWLIKNGVYPSLFQTPFRSLMC